VAVNSAAGGLWQRIRQPGGRATEFISPWGRASPQKNSAPKAVPVNSAAQGTVRGASPTPPRGRRAAVVPACRHDNGKLSTPYHTSKIHHIFVRLPTKFGVIPSRFLFFMNFGIFNGRKIQINNSRFLKIRKKILQLDWIFPNLCAKFQLQIIFFEGFRGGGPAGT